MISVGPKHIHIARKRRIVNESQSINNYNCIIRDEIDEFELSSSCNRNLEKLKSDIENKHMELHKKFNIK